MMTVSARDRLLHDLAGELDDLERRDLRRRLVTVERIDGPVVTAAGGRLVNWCSNDYLGLSAHPRLREAAAAAAAEFGIGARASRLLSGTTRWHERLEADLAAWFGQEAAAVFPSGYHANLGALSVLLDARDVVIVDRLAHASLVEAARATRARLRVFRHNDAGHAAELLAAAGRARRRLVVTEGIFSMEGDAAPLSDLLDAAERHGASVYLDDAHGAFAAGATGRGSPEAAGCAHDRFLYMGTLGKALGCQGGFAAGPRPFIELIRNRARTYVYTTALAVPVAAAACDALRVVAGEPSHAERLRSNVARLHHALPPSRRSPSHIVPVMAGEPAAALRLADRLWAQGIWAPAIRPPTVPRGTARLRLSVTAAHTEEHIDALVQALKAADHGPSTYAQS